MTNENRYANDWNAYSQSWDTQFGGKYRNLGDEWNDDGTVERKRDNFYFTAYAERWIRADMTALEVGPGGGKWTVRIAPRVKKLIVLDVSEDMLIRTRERCDSLGISNVEYILANGRDFQPIADQSIDFFFSYDVFVHIPLEDTWPYTQEIARVLVPGGIGACHYAVNTIQEAWDRIEQHNEWYRFGQHTLGQFYYSSPEALRQMYGRCGLYLFEQHLEAWNCVCVFQKPSDTAVPHLEQLLRLLISPEANDSQKRAQVISEISTLSVTLQQQIEPLLQKALAEEDFYKRVVYAAQIRRIWRGT